MRLALSEPSADVAPLGGWRDSKRDCIVEPAISAAILPGSRQVSAAFGLKRAFSTLGAAARMARALASRHHLPRVW